MTDSKKPTLSEIVAREQAATGGPWEYGANNEEPDGRIWVSLGASEAIRGKVVFLAMGLGSLTEKEISDNIRFIAHARADIPYLFDLVERMGRIIRDDVNPISEIDTIRVRASQEIRSGCNFPHWQKNVSSAT